jgi:pyruvate dehydrogenase E2 component (dihydrolipoamide acetyltransferase)
VNNIGALGNIIGTSIIPYGTTAILSVGRAVEKPVVRHGDVVVLPMMEVTLSFDHRVIDGGLAQKFLNIVQQNLEDAVRLLA